MLAFTAASLPPIAARATPTETVLHQFGGYKDGSAPIGGLLPDGTGGFYGTTSDTNSGTPTAHGTVYYLAPPSGGSTTWTKTILYKFLGGTDGEAPNSTLVADPSGNLFGTMASGVFEIMPPATTSAPWTESVIAMIPGAPIGALVRRGDGALFGVTNRGGNTGDGSVFALIPPQPGQSIWTQEQIYTFVGGSDGGGSESGLTAGPSGEFFGTTPGGGNSVGTVFELAPPMTGQTNWTKTQLYIFKNDPSDGQFPYGSLLMDRSGNLYSTTSHGGKDNYGTVFRLTPPSGSTQVWTETILHQFTKMGPGMPFTGVTAGIDGTLFGSTPLDIFKLSPPSGSIPRWRIKVLWEFTGAEDVVYPVANLVRSRTGVLYGTALYGGLTKCQENAGCGGVFEVTP